MSSETLYGNCHFMPLFSCVLAASKLCLHPHRTACSHSNGTDVIPPLLHPFCLCLSPRCWPVSSAASHSSRLLARKNADCGTILSAWTYRGDTGLYFDFRVFLEDHSLLLSPLVWMFDCRFDGAEQARLIEGFAARGASVGGPREKTLCPRLRLSSAL
ncbi:hypothetical protein F7725_022765 [Dissostichus mawsoni]|uniref:Uncharacterized protein n=1 Tax=Dissostichus mawsoni TaxID=36200 RepID=A0A7J5YZ16_DISMA|nr:hypothetical protein F7725_022765 [Dissostichus mawsoni]